MLLCCVDFVVVGLLVVLVFVGCGVRLVVGCFLILVVWWFCFGWFAAWLGFVMNVAWILSLGLDVVGGYSALCPLGGFAGYFAWWWLDGIWVVYWFVGVVCCRFWFLDGLRGWVGLGCWLCGVNLLTVLVSCGLA